MGAAFLAAFSDQFLIIQETNTMVLVSRPITFIDIAELKPHEEIKEKKFSGFLKFASKLQRERLKTKPIWIDAKTKVILDGHHRYTVFKELGCKIVPCIEVDYLNDKSISVLPRRQDIPVSKELVIERGLSGKPFPPKTTKHVFSEEAPMMWVNLRKLRIEN